MPHPPTVVFYVSAHGFGHAVRQTEVIAALAARLPRVRVLIRSDVPRWLFGEGLRGPFELVPGATDTGVVQIDSLRLDPEASIRQAWEFHATLDDRAAAEARWLEREQVTLVAADMPPLAFAAARAAGIPAVGIGNFTWDWIYAHYRSRVPLPPELVPSLETAYAGAAQAWRLPMAAGFESFPRVVDAPLVARHATRPRDATLDAIGCAPDRPVVLLSFGRYGVDVIDWAAVRRQRELQVVVTRDSTDHGPAVTPAPNQVVVDVDLPELRRRGFGYPDVVAAADIVLTKPGYGIIAECAANGTAMLYTSRGDFPEYPVLVEAMPSMVRCAFLEQADLFAGRWQHAVDAVLDQPPVDRPASHGAATIADGLTSYLAGRSSPGTTGHRRSEPLQGR